MEIGFFIFQIIILVGSVVIHEVSHGVAAEYLGDDTARRAGRLSMNPLKHLDPMGSFVVPGLLALLGGPVFGWARPVPYDPRNVRGGKWGEAAVAVAGPVSNIVLAVVFGVFIRILVAALLPYESILYLMTLFALIVQINLSLAVFNLIPVPPLDGSKILFAVLPKRFSGLQLAIERYGFLVFFIFVAFGGGFIGPLVNAMFGIIVGR